MSKNEIPSRSICQKEKEGTDLKSSILADRLGKLDAAKDGWKKRIQPSDAVRFSVEGKMFGKTDSQIPPRPSLSILSTQRTKRSPKAAKFKSKKCNNSLKSMPSSPCNEQLSNPISR